MARQPIIYVATGKRGVGKTYTTTKYIRKYVVGNPTAGIPGRKVLIFDVNNEFSNKEQFPDIRRINIRDIPQFAASKKIEIRRIAPFFDDNRKMSLNGMAETLTYIVENFKSGLLLIEDINKYLSDSMPNDLIGMICTNRHEGLDVIIHYQSLGRLTPKIWQNVNFMRLHKNFDSVDRHENKFPDKIEAMRIAELIVNNRFDSGDEHYYLFIDFEYLKIHPLNASKDEVMDAISLYISENYNEAVGRMLNRRGRDGKLLYTAQNVIQAKEAELLKRYFVFK